MAWKILCSLSAYKPDTLAKDYGPNVAGAMKNYSHAFLLMSPKKAFAATEKNLSLAEFSSQKCSVTALPNGLTAGAVAGYYTWNDRLAVIVAEGGQEIQESALNEFGKDFVTAAASAAGKKGYPNDCLGYCIQAVKSLTGVTVPGPNG